MNMYSAGQKIQELRKNQNLTQAKLAEGITSRSYLSQIENGTVQPSMKILRKLAEKLNCEIDDLFTGNDKERVIILDTQKLLSSLEYSVTNREYENIEEDLFVIEKRIGELSHKELGLYFYCKGKLLKDYYKDFEESSIFLNKSIKEYHQKSFHLERIRSINELASMYTEQNQLSEAFELLEIAYKESIFFKISGLERIKLLFNLGLLHGKQGEYYSGIRYLNSLIELSKRTNIYYKTGKAYMVLGLCHKGRKEYTNALDAYKKASFFFESTGDKLNLAGIFINIGIIYRLINKSDESIYYLQNALDMYEKLDDYFGTLNAIYELAVSNHINGLNDKIPTLFERFSNSYSADTFPTSILLKFLVLMGDINLYEHETKKALEFYKQAFSHKNCTPEFQREINIHAAKLFSKTLDINEMIEWNLKLETIPNSPF